MTKGGALGSTSCSLGEKPRIERIAASSSVQHLDRPRSGSSDTFTPDHERTSTP